MFHITLIGLELMNVGMKHGHESNIVNALKGGGVFVLFEVKLLLLTRRNSLGEQVSISVRRRHIEKLSFVRDCL